MQAQKNTYNDFTMRSTCIIYRGESRAAATFKMERFVVIVNGFQRLNIITKHSILDVAAVLDPPLIHILIIYLIVHVFL